ncbi:MAG: efflux RND transporter permease subunit [Coriobacteriia bacterium]|nr:efflux RND transporter permease subunit [Coriobacteriia bacterium]
MDRITRFSLKNSAAVILVALLVTLGGMWSASQLKRETMPDISIPVVAVVTPYPGAAPGDVYDNVTEPLEQALRGVPGVKRVSAQSQDSVSVVVAEFSFSEDMDEAETNVNKILDTVKLPENSIAPKVNRISFGSAPIMKIAVMGDSDGTPADVVALRADVRERVIPALQSVEGVGEARLAADAPGAIRITLDPDRLKDEGLTAESVIQQLQAANLSFPIGAVDLGASTQPIRVGGSIEGVRDIENFTVAVYPNQGEMMGEAFGAIGEGMGQLGSAVGGLAKGLGAIGQATGQLGAGVGQLGSATGEVAMQSGLINGIQQIQAQMYTLKYDTLPPMKAAASQMPTDSPAYAELQGQIYGIEQVALPQMQQTVDSMQAQITASQNKLKELQPSGGATAPSGGMSMPAGGSSGGSGSAPTLEMKIGRVKLADIAEVSYGPADGTVGTRANGRPAALIDIVKTQEANTVNVNRGVDTEMGRLSGDFPVAAEVLTVYDASRGINASVDGMVREGMLGALFAVIVILLFLRSWRATIIAAVSIPLSVLVALGMLSFTDVTLNVMTLGGLTVAIGRVVDDSIVVIENIFRHMQMGEKPTVGMIRAATHEVSEAITYSTLTTVAVFLPLGLVTGVIGKIFLPFALTVAIALLASLLVAVTVVPLMAKWLLLRAKVPAEERTDSKTMTWYRHALSWSLDHRWMVVAGALALFVGSLALIPVIGTGFVPEAQEKYLQIEVTYPQGTKSTKVDGTVLAIEELVAKDPDVEIHQSTVGGSNDFSMSGDIGGTNKAVVYVRLGSDAEMEQVLARLKKSAEPLKTDGAQIVFQRVDASGTNSSLDIVVVGDDLAAIRRTSEDVEKVLVARQDLENVTSNLGDSQKQLVVDVDQAKAAKYGLNAAMVAGTVRGFVAEQQAGSVKLDGKPTDVMYSLALDPVKKATQIKSLELATPLGENVTLSKIAKVEETGSPMAVLTRNGQQYAAVSARITERDSGSVIAAVREDLKGVKLPPGVTLEVAGAAEQMNESFSQLNMALLIAIGAVYLVMIIAFGEAVAPLAIMFSLPLAVVGGLFGLLIAGLPLDIPAMIGALMLIGIVVANAIMLIERVQQNQRAGSTRREALMEAGVTRTRPILMTAATTIMALVPLASGFAEGALISQSLAVIVIGGLTTSTLMTLLVVPVAFDLLEGAKERLFGRETRLGETAEA